MTCAGGGGIPSFTLSELSLLSTPQNNESRSSSKCETEVAGTAGRGDARTCLIVRGVAGDGSTKRFLGELGVIDGGPRTSSDRNVSLWRAVLEPTFAEKN